MDVLVIISASQVHSDIKAYIVIGVQENPIRKFFEEASNFAEKGFRLG
jgi:hypothetical protein